MSRSSSNSGISLEVDSGEVLCIVGPSGSGKSTFLRCTNHLERVDGGRLSVDGQLVGYRQKGGDAYPLTCPEGVVVEAGPPRQILSDPQHDRTKAFLSKVL